MHKFLALLLAAVMMIGVFSAMPIFATEAMVAATAVDTIDGTESDETFRDLIITEILINSKSDTWRDDYSDDESVTVFSSPDAMDYIEVYNAGDRPVNIYDYCILSAPYRDFTGESKESGSNANAIPYKFTYKNIIYEGDIHSTASGAKSDPKTYKNSCTNPLGAGEILPGETAVIWYWTAQTDTACFDKGYSLGRTDENGRTFAYFRDYYGMDSKTKIFVTNAKASAVQNSQTGDDWFGSLEYDYIYALAKATYNETQPAITAEPDKNGNVVRALTSTAQTNLRCFAAYTTYNSVGIVNTQNMDNVSAYYVPSNCAPDLINQNNQKVAELEQTTYTPFADYVQAGCALSYRETAIISFTEEPSPGGMPSWQWQYIEQSASLEHDPDNYIFGYGLAYIDQYVFDRAESLVFAMTQYENHGEWLWSITGKPYGVKGDRNMTAQEKAEKLMEFYDQLMDCYVSDWLDADGNAANTEIVGADGRLITTKTGETYDWVAKADAYMKATCVPALHDVTTGYTEIKTDYTKGFVDRKALSQKWMKVIPQTRINEATKIWEISYDEGVTWTSLGVKAVGDSVKTPILRSNSYFWEVSYDGGASWDYLPWSATSVPSPRLRINTDTNVWEISYDMGETWSSLWVKAIANIVPRVCINAATSEWEISYDMGETWESLGVLAVGDRTLTPTMRVNETKRRWEISYNDGESWTLIDGLPSAVTMPKLRINETTGYWEYSADEGSTWSSLYTRANGYVVPRFRIHAQTDEWEISYDGGVAWKTLGVKATGADGTVPKVRINAEARVWEVSYDNGASWQSLGVSSEVKNGILPKLRINSETDQWEISYDDGEVWQSLGVVATGKTPSVPQMRINGITGYWEISYDDGGAWKSLEVRAVGENGIMPQLQINDKNNEWEVTYDGGTTWTTLGVKATGAQGASPKLRVNRNNNEWEISYDDGSTWTSLGVDAFEKEQEENLGDATGQVQDTNQGTEKAPDENDAGDGVLVVIVSVAAVLVCSCVVVAVLIFKRKNQSKKTEL